MTGRDIPRRPASPIRLTAPLRGRARKRGQNPVLPADFNPLFTVDGKSRPSRPAASRLYPPPVNACRLRREPISVCVSTLNVVRAMKFGVPWSVKGVRPEARETAREAARRAGVPLSEWLNAVILQQAEEQGVEPDTRVDDGNDDYGDVHHRLDELSRRIEQMNRSGPAAYAPRRSRSDSDNTAQMIERLDRPPHPVGRATPAAPSPPAP